MLLVGPSRFNSFQHDDSSGVGIGIQVMSALCASLVGNIFRYGQHKYAARVLKGKGSLLITSLGKYSYKGLEGAQKILKYLLHATAEGMGDTVSPLIELT
jgi:putative salt-induced outer membrane protein YdiY